MPIVLTMHDEPSDRYFSEHNMPYYQAECPACIVDHNAEVDSEIANLGIRLAQLLDSLTAYKPSPAETCLILDILKLAKTYKETN